MEQPSIRRKFNFYQEPVNSEWAVDNIPFRFPNAGNFVYRPFHVEHHSKIINIDIRRNVFNDFLDPPLNILADVLQRNTAYPLCITISWEAVAFTSRWAPPPWKDPIGPDIRPDSIELLKPYLDFLIHHIDRWKAFRIFSPIIARMENQFSRIPNGGAPSLQSLILMDVEQYDEIKGLFPILLPIRKSSKNFRELLFFDNRNRACGSSIPDLFTFSVSKHFPFVPYDWLTSLRVDYKLSATDALALFNRGSRLVECVLSSLTGATLLPDDIKPATCSSLKYLQLSNSEEDFSNFQSTGTLYSFLKKISTPKLKRLVLRYEDEWDMEAFTTFITRSSCTLQSLHIIKMGMKTEELLACLELAGDCLTDFLFQERIEEKQLGKFIFTEHFMEHFRYEDPRRHGRDRPCLCPKLKMISIGDRTLDGSGGFGRALGSRVGVTPLHEVRVLSTDTLRSGANIQERDVKELEELGKNIHVCLARDPCDGL